MSRTVKVTEEYENYFPSVHVYGSVELLLRYVPEEHLVGLHRIILTNSELLAKRWKGKVIQERRRFRPADSRGAYFDGQILLLMDRILEPWPEVFLLLPPFKTLFIGEVLYHEIGHHIHHTAQPGFRDSKEATAEEWKEELMGRLLRQRYWYLLRVFRLLRWVRSQSDRSHES